MDLITEAACIAQERIGNAGANFYYAMGAEAARPMALYKPKLSRDGDQWCFLFGENLQEGVAGFGSSPEEASRAFDKAWFESITSTPSRDAGSKEK